MQYNFTILSAATLAIFATQVAAAAYRSDARCGKNFGGALCNPKGEFGGCCSHAGWCGSTDAYCLPANNCQSGCKSTSSSIKVSSTSSLKASSTSAIATPAAVKTSSTSTKATTSTKVAAATSTKASSVTSSVTKSTASASATAGPNDRFVVSNLQAYYLPAGMGPSGHFNSYCGVSFNVLNVKTGAKTSCLDNYYPDTDPKPTGKFTCDDDSFLWSFATVTDCANFSLRIVNNMMSINDGFSYVGKTPEFNDQSDRTVSPWTNAAGIRSYTTKSNVDIVAPFGS